MWAAVSCRKENQEEASEKEGEENFQAETGRGERGRVVTGSTFKHIDYNMVISVIS